MPIMDHDYSEELMKRLADIPLDAKPLWGSLTRDTMIAHLAQAVRYSMGRTAPLPDRSTWVSRNLIGPLICNGWLRIPRNVRMQGTDNPPPADLETLHALIEEYLGLVQADELRPHPHVYFGDIGVDGWARLHVAHFEHHLRQFGA